MKHTRSLVGLFVGLVAIVSVVPACRQTPSKPAATATVGGGPVATGETPAARAAQPNTSAGMVASGTPPPAKPVPAQLPAVLAKVNAESVERWEMENAIHGIESRAGTPMPADRRDQIIRGLLDQLVEFHALAQEAHARKFDGADQEVNARIAQIRGQFSDEQAFQQALSAQSLSLANLQRQTRMGLSVDKLIESTVAPTISVSDADVANFYGQNTARFEQGETVHASHILIRVPPQADAAQKQEARARATQILRQLRAGADFATLARQQSQDPGSAQAGGDLGFFAKGQMTPPFETAAFALKPDALSTVVETTFGYHIIKVSERRPPHTATLGEVGPQIKQFLTNQQRQAKLAELVAQIKAKAKIEILV